MRHQEFSRRIGDHVVSRHEMAGNFGFAKLGWGVKWRRVRTAGAKNAQIAKAVATAVKIQTLLGQIMVRAPIVRIADLGQNTGIVRPNRTQHFCSRFRAAPACHIASDQNQVRLAQRLG